MSTYIILRLFEDKVYLAVLAKGINMNKGVLPQDDSTNYREESVETKIAIEVNCEVETHKHSLVQRTWFL